MQYLNAKETMKVLDVQELTPNDSVVWQVPDDVPFGSLPTYFKTFIFRYKPDARLHSSLTRHSPTETGSYAMHAFRMSSLHHALGLQIKCIVTSTGPPLEAADVRSVSCGPIVYGEADLK